MTAGFGVRFLRGLLALLFGALRFRQRLRARFNARLTFGPSQSKNVSSGPGTVSIMAGLLRYDPRCRARVVGHSPRRPPREAALSYPMGYGKAATTQRLQTV